MPPVLVLVVAFFAGAVPFSHLVARSVAGVDLRLIGNGTVSGTGVYRVAGLVPLVTAGILDVFKGALGPLLAGGDRPGLAAVAGGLAVTGHNWSPYLRGAGGRGIAPALGVLVVLAWPGAALILSCVLIGKIFDQTGLGTFVSLLLVVPVVAVTHGGSGALAGALAAGPMLIKRALGNSPPPPPRGPSVVHRVLFDRDPAAQAAT